MATRSPRAQAIRGGAAPAADPTPAIDTPVVPLRESFEQEDQLEQFIATYAGEQDYRVRLERLTERGKRAYLGTLPFGPELLEDVKQQFGKGDFIGRIVNGDNQYIKGATVRFTIAADPTPAMPNAAPAANADAAPRPRREEIFDMGIMQLFQTMQEQQKVSSVMLERLAQPQKSIDMVAVLAAVTPIVLELIKGSRTKSLSVDDIAAAVEAKVGRSGSTSTKDMLGALREVLELREMLGGGGGGDGGGDVVRDAVRYLGPVLANAFGGGGGPAAPVDESRRLPAPPPAAAPSDPGAEPVSEPVWVQQLRPHVGQLVRVAHEGGEPRQLAFAIISYFMPPAQKGMLRELVAQENAHSQIINAFPEMNAFPEWLTDFLDEARIVFELKEPDDDGDGAPR